MILYRTTVIHLHGLASLLCQTEVYQGQRHLRVLFIGLVVLLDWMTSPSECFSDSTFQAPKHRQLS